MSRPACPIHCKGNVVGNFLSFGVHFTAASIRWRCHLNYCTLHFAKRSVLLWKNAPVY
uniref:Uncharacterized protein n=1 Tax=Anguilla anguilla TaxID=7936 RepID=A0A0E9V985_ANGAN